MHRFFGPLSIMLGSLALTMAVQVSSPREATPVDVDALYHKASPAVIDLPEVTIVVTDPAPVAPSVAPSRPVTRQARPSAPVQCRVHVLEQGGSPSAPTVLACG